LLFVAVRLPVAIEGAAEFMAPLEEDFFFFSIGDTLIE
jgi:hypothetical protein